MTYFCYLDKFFFLKNSASLQIPSSWDWWQLLMEGHPCLMRLVWSTSEWHHSLVSSGTRCIYPGVAEQEGGMLWPPQRGGQMCRQGICHWATESLSFTQNPEIKTGAVIAVFFTGGTLLVGSTMGFAERHYHSSNSRV